MHIAVVDKTEACAAIPARPSSAMHVLARRGIPIIPFLSFLHFHLIKSTTALPLCDEPCSSYATFQGPDQDSYCQDAQTFKCYSPNDTAGGCVQCTQSPELADTTTRTTTTTPAPNNSDFVKCSATEMNCLNGASCQVRCDLPAGYYCDTDDQTAYCYCSGNSGTSSSR